LQSYKNCPTALSLIICNYFLQLDKVESHSPVKLFAIALAAFVPLHAALCANALAVGMLVLLHLMIMIMLLLSDIAAKWILLGRRAPGIYSWDKSSYCQVCHRLHESNSSINQFN
jgi:hypothetical protein